MMSDTRKSVSEEAPLRVASRRSAPGRTSPLRFHSVQEVAEILGLSARSVRRLIADGKLPVHRFGRSVRIAECDLRVFIALHRID